MGHGCSYPQLSGICPRLGDQEPVKVERGCSVLSTLEIRRVCYIEGIGTAPVSPEVLESIRGTELSSTIGAPCSLPMSQRLL